MYTFGKRYSLFLMWILLMRDIQDLVFTGAQPHTASRANSFNFKLKDVSVEDLPKAVAIHEILGLAMLASTWKLAYHFPPSRIPALAGPIEKMKALVPSRVMVSLSSSKVLSSRLGVSFVEASCLRKLIRPATIPLKLMATFVVMKKLSPSSLVPASNSAGAKMCQTKTNSCGSSSCSLPRR